MNPSKAIEILQNLMHERNNQLAQPLKPNNRKRIKQESEALLHAIKLIQWRETVKEENQQTLF